MEATIWQGRRWSAANAYLRPALKPRNCRLVRGLARRSRDRGRPRHAASRSRAAAGVEVIRARREVILAASSINSPKLLMLSGIGPAAHLAEHGIEVVADRPGVGRTCRTTWSSTSSWPRSQPVTLYRYWNLSGRPMSARTGC